MKIAKASVLFEDGPIHGQTRVFDGTIDLDVEMEAAAHGMHGKYLMLPETTEGVLIAKWQNLPHTERRKVPG